VAGARLQGRSPRALIGGGLLLIAIGSLLLAVLIGPDSSWQALMPGYAVIGTGVGLVMPTLASSGMAAVPAHRGGMAAGALNTARQLGFAIGVAVLGTLFAARATDRLDTTGSFGDAAGTAHGLAAGQAGRIIEAVPDPGRQPVISALHDAAAGGLDAGFLVAAGVGLVGALAVAVLVRPAPRDAAEVEPEWATTA
jgi:hypothetical protein